MFGVSMYRRRSLSRYYGKFRIYVSSLMSVGNDQQARLLCSFFVFKNILGGLLNAKKGTTDFPLFLFHSQLPWWLKHSSDVLLCGQTTGAFLFEWITELGDEDGSLEAMKRTSKYNARREATRTEEDLHCRHKPQHLINTWCQELGIKTT
jgi:hypothetical protein